LGHKVHPFGFRIGIIRDWQARWYADKHFIDNLQEDIRLRQAIQTKYAEAGISLVEIERQTTEVSITIHTAWPGVVIGRGGQRVEEMRIHLESLIGKKIRLTIREIQQPELDAYLVARTIAEQIERRVAFRRAMKQAIFRTIQAGAKGVRISCAGRLGGAEIARRQTMHQGRVPLHTLRADIDYGFIEARTTLGRIGVKVWVYKGDIHPEPKVAEIAEVAVEPVVSEIKEKPAEPVAEISAETVPTASAEPEEKAAQPAARRKTSVTPTAEPEEKPAGPVAEISTETAPPASAEPEEKAAKPAARRKTRVTKDAELEEKDVTAETGEISQDS
jgi:small subunit ribosomal protein S3